MEGWGCKVATVQLQGFSAFYPQKKNYLVALNHVDLAVDDGDFLVLIGPSGCGKTTLLKAIIGSVDHTDGLIQVDGVDVADVASRDRHFSYVSQQFDLYPGMTVFDNLAFPLKMMKTPIAEIIERVNGLAAQLDLSILLTRKPRQLSLGQQQKVAIGRALIKHPRLMLFDEPFSNLDQPKREEMRRYLKQVHATHRITTIFVTHDRDDAIVLATKVAILDHGSLIYHGTKDDYLTNPSGIARREYLFGE